MQVNSAKKNFGAGPMRFDMRQLPDGHVPFNRMHVGPLMTSSEKREKQEQQNLNESEVSNKAVLHENVGKPVDEDGWDKDSNDNNE